MLFSHFPCYFRKMWQTDYTLKKSVIRAVLVSILWKYIRFEKNPHIEVRKFLATKILVLATKSENLGGQLALRFFPEIRALKCLCTLFAPTE